MGVEACSPLCNAFVALIRFSIYYCPMLRLLQNPARSTPVSSYIYSVPAPIKRSCPYHVCVINSYGDYYFALYIHAIYYYYYRYYINETYKIHGDNHAVILDILNSVTTIGEKYRKPFNISNATQTPHICSTME